MKRIFAFLICFIFTFSLSITVFASDNTPISSENIETAAFSDYLAAIKSGENLSLTDVIKPDFSFDVRSICLCEAKTGTVLYEYNKDEKYAPASVTKIMTLLLVFEALDSGKISLTDTVTASENAASMGGTQIYLKVGETMTVEDLIKSVVVPSANDAAVALAEFLCGSEEEFVRQMNEKAKEIGLKNTNFTNCTGLFDDETHLTTAYDISVMSRELIKHEKIFDYTTIWMDSLRNGEFTLSNTNKMLKTYTGMKGLKTGYTQKSLYCFSGVAEKNGMTLIVTVMGAPTSDVRFSAAKKLLDFGFASFSLAKPENIVIPEIKAEKGKTKSLPISYKNDFSIVVPKGWEKELSYEISVPEKIKAPLSSGAEIGNITFKLKDENVGVFPITLSENFEKATALDYFSEFLKILFVDFTA